MYNGEGNLYILSYSLAWQVIEINKLSSTQNIEMKSYQDLRDDGYYWTISDLDLNAEAGDSLGWFHLGMEWSLLWLYKRELYHGR